MKNCPDCGGDFENGVMLDTTYGAVIIQRYAKSNNIPDDSRNFKLAVTESNFEDLRRVVAYRCMKCNRIFQYAQDAVVMQSLTKRTRRMYLVVVIVLIVIFAAVFLPSLFIF